ncbi:MAG TPA: YihY/virulence factor BrkB family protein [Solirubrobacteraceae bacterium]|nr:YihY/virulence factor BrkB family protein [Solirubrobacteraceae bacterium]
MSVRDAVDRVTRGYDEHDILTFASAIAFKVLFAVIPLILFGLGLLGGLGLEEQWTEEWARTVRESMSPDVFRIVDDTVRRVLSERQTFWMTAGGLIAVWEISGAMRGIMDAFDRIYGAHRERSLAERLRVSLVLGLAVTVLLLIATGCVVLGDDLLREIGVDHRLVLLVRYPLAAAILFAVVALLLAYAPVDHQPLSRITVGSALIVAAWFGTSLALGWYLTSVAEYGSVFGALATVWIVLTYLYFSSTAFLTGAELDSMMREQTAA